MSLEVSHVSQWYGTGEGRVNALKDVSIKVEDGQQISIIGKSGSGKSTLLNILGGMDTPKEGHVIVDGEILSGSERKRTKYRREKIGYVFQFFYLIPSLSVYDNISLPLHLNHKTDLHRKVVELAEELEIADKLSSYPSQLSGGQQQRVAIARAVIHEPKVILCDEPTGNLDSESAETVMKLLIRYSRNNQNSLVVVTHDEEIAASFSHQYRMRDGECECIL
jgi:putative ABC transport system ATP-binding protein